MASKRWNFRITKTRIVMLAIFLLTLLFMVWRYCVGLGASTNLNDRYTWGLWIGADMNVIALAGAGFSMAIITHVFHAHKYEPLARRCLLMSFIAYVLVLLILIVEIGRWDNFWRPFVSPGVHSPMFEVYMCIVAYMILQAIELVDVGTEKIAPKFNKKMQKIMPVVFVIACVVPLGHQASLGSLYLAMPAKLDSIWATSAMPWLFLLSAFFVGPAVAILEYIWSSKRYNMKIDVPMLVGLTRISAVLMAVYLVIKVADLVVRGQIGRIFEFSVVSNMFLLEITLLTIVPIIITLLPFGKTKGGVMTFGFSAVFGLILTRLNVVFTGMYAHLGGGYFPSWFEIFSTVGLICICVLAYLYITENFPVFYGLPGDADGETDLESSPSGFNQAIM